MGRSKPLINSNNADFQPFSWFVVGQIFASVALKQISARDPYEFRIPIYTQVRTSPSYHLKTQLKIDFFAKWAMIGAIALIFLALPESPWWLVSKGKIDKAAKVLTFCNGKVDGYDVQEQLVRSVLHK